MVILIIIVISEALIFTFYYLGYLAIKSENFAKAEFYLEKISLLPLLPSNFYTQLAYVYEREGKWKTAIKSYEKALTKNPRKIDLHNHLSQLYYGEYNLDRAIYHLKKFWEVKPTRDSSYNLAIMFYEKDDLNSALYFLKLAIKFDPKNHHLKEDLKLIQKEKSAEKNMAIKESKHFIIKYNKEINEQIAMKVMEYLEEAKEKISSIFPQTSSGITVVKIFDDWTFKEITKKSTPQVVATTINNKLILPSPSYLPILRNLKQILVHEYIHIVLYHISLGNIPTYLNEGIAEFFSQNEVPEFKERLLKEALLSGGLIPLKELSLSFENFKGKDLTLAYIQSYYLVEYLVKTYGWGKIQDFARQIGRDRDLGKVSRTVFGKDMEEIEKDFYTFLKDYL